MLYTSREKSRLPFLAVRHTPLHLKMMIAYFRQNVKFFEMMGEKLL
jgi:hypothetical protein